MRYKMQWKRQYISNQLKRSDNASRMFVAVLTRVGLVVCLTAEPDMDRVFELSSITYVGGDDKRLPFREIIRRLEVHHGANCFLVHIHTVADAW